MNIKYFLLIGCLSVGSCSKSTTTDEVSSDGRFGKACQFWLKHPNIPLCKPSSIRLFSNPEFYDGKYVTVVGFLKKEKDYFVLYVSEDIYISSFSEGGVELLDEAKLSRDLKEKAVMGIAPVRVTGKFDAQNNPRARLAVGMFTEIDSVFVEQKLPMNTTQ